MQDSSAMGGSESIFRVTQTIMPKFDPAVGSDYSSNVVLINVYDSLVFPTHGGAVMPWVAESWEISADGRTWDFKIREDILFHSGNKLTAHDVAYSMERLLTIGEGYAFLFFEYIDSVEVVDEYKVRFRCKSSYGPLINSLVRLYILDKDVMEANYSAGDYGKFGDYGRAYLLTNSAGSGPYIVDTVATNISVSGKKHNNYWAGLHADTPVRFLVYASNDAVTVKTMISRQELESADMWQTTENIASMLNSDSSLGLAHNYTGGGLNLFMNNQKAPMDDKNVREAFGYLIDYVTICEQLLPDSKTKNSVIPSNLLGYTPTFSFEFNLDKAKAALSKSRYADTINKMSIELVWNSESADREKVALMIQSAAMQIGIDIKIIELPWSTIVANAADINTSPMTTIVSVAPVTSDSGAQFVSILRSKAVGTWENMNWANDPALDAMIDDALTIVDIEKRAAAYGRIQEYCAENFIFIPISEQAERLVHQASYVDLDPQIGLLGSSFYLPDIRVYPDRRK
jgi:peptide/nickel transport system substrate-binding protein